MGFIIRQAPFFMILFSLQKMDRILLHECLSTPSPNPIPAPSQPPSPFPELLQHWGFQTTTSSYVIGWTNLLGLETSEFWVDIRAQGDMGPGPVWERWLFRISALPRWEPHHGGSLRQQWPVGRLVGRPGSQAFPKGCSFSHGSHLKPP